jgi:hypothetical protein
MQSARFLVTGGSQGIGENDRGYLGWREKEKEAMLMPERQRAFAGISVVRLFSRLRRR